MGSIPGRDPSPDGIHPRTPLNQQERAELQVSQTLELLFFGDFASVYNEESAFNIHEIDSR